MKNTGAKIRAGAEVIDFANNEDAFQRAVIVVLERLTPCSCVRCQSA
jgi:hypothetical protein